MQKYWNEIICFLHILFLIEIQIDYPIIENIWMSLNWYLVPWAIEGFLQSMFLFTNCFHQRIIISGEILSHSFDFCFTSFKGLVLLLNRFFNAMFSPSKAFWLAEILDKLAKEIYFPFEFPQNSRKVAKFLF